MRNFFYFLISHSTVMLFLLLELLSIILVVNFNDYHKAAFFNSSNEVTGSLFSMKESVVKYFDYGSANKKLLAENIELKSKIDLYEKILNRDSVRVDSLSDSCQFIYRGASVLNTSVSKSRNYLTIDAGREDGILPEMAVVGTNGVVGLVMAVSKRYATVIPIVNTNFRLSAKLKNSNFFGSLTWDGASPRYAWLNEVPEHASVAVGDSVVTSGYSAYFPQGLPIGKVAAIEMDDNEGFYMLKIELAEDFNSIYHVEIIENTCAVEQKELEERST